MIHLAGARDPSVSTIPAPIRYTNTAGTDPPHCGKPEDPAKMAYSRMDPSERGLSAKRDAQNERTESRYAGCRGERAAAGTRRAGGGARASQRTFPVDAVAEELEEVGSARPGLEPEPCSRGPRAQARVTRCERRSARRARILVPVSNASRSCTLQCGERVDPAKMANSRMALIARGPSFTSPNAKSRKGGGIRLPRRARTWSRWWQPPSGCRRSGTRLTRRKRDARRQTACARSYGHRGRR